MHLSRKPQKRTAVSPTGSILVWAIIAVGVLLRLHQYWLDRSLWIDEAFLALNILSRSYTELLQPLDYNQGAPFGFLVIERFVTQVWNDSESALRLFPLLSGLAAIFLMFRLAKVFCQPWAVPLAMGLFVLCDRLIYYSAEVKQYSSDVLLTLLLYVCVIKLLPKRAAERLPWGAGIGLAAVGAITVWISHPAVFVLAGTGLCLIAMAGLSRQWQRLGFYAAIYAVPTISFLLFYQISIRKLINNEYLQDSWSEGHNSFLPLPPTSLNELKWFFDSFFEVFSSPLGSGLTGIAALAFLTGCGVMQQRQPRSFWLLISPILVTLLASGLQKYPFQGQLLLFIVPLLVIVIANGALFITQLTWDRARFVGILFSLLLLIYPAYYAVLNLKDPTIPPDGLNTRVREDIKPVLSYVRSHWQNGDRLYLYYAAQYAFKYYAPRYGFDVSQAVPTATYTGSWFAPALSSDSGTLVVGQYAREDWQIFAREIDQFQGNPRVWFVFSHVRDRRSEIDEEDAFIDILNRAGQQIDNYHSTEAAAYLYRFE